MIAPASLCAIALASLPHPPAAQVDDAHVLLRQGDALPSGETVDLLLSHRILDNGSWAALCWVSGAPVVGTTREGIVRDGALALAEGDVLPSGETVSAIRALDLGPTGVLAALVDLRAPVTGAESSAIWRPESLLVRTGPIGNPGIGLPPGVALDQIYDFALRAPYMAVYGRTEIAGTVTNALLRYDFSATPTNPLVQLIAQAGQSVAPLPSTFASVTIGETLGIDANGGVGFGGTVVGSTPTSSVRVAWANGVGVLVDGTPGPAPNSTWETPSLAPTFQYGDAGFFAVSSKLRLSNGTLRSVVYKNNLPVAVEGGGINGATGVLVRPFDRVCISMADTNTLFFAVPLGTLTSTLYTGLFADGELLIRTGQSTASGLTIASIPFASPETLDASPDGNRCLFRATLSGGVQALCALERSVGFVPNCVSNANSTGVRGRLIGAGSSYFAANDLVLTAIDLPLNAFGYLNTSRTQGFVANPGGSAGNLCLGGGIGRYAGNVQSSGALGAIATRVDLLSLPQPSGSIAAQVGETWGFQLWHRDAGPSGPVSNFTDPLAVTVR